MIKYYKTPDVISTDKDGNAYCINGVIILDTSRMDDVSNETALHMVNRLGFIKCSKIEAEDRVVITPVGSVTFTTIVVTKFPTSVIEPRFGEFIIDGERTIDTTATDDVLSEQLYEIVE